MDYESFLDFVGLTEAEITKQANKYKTINQYGIQFCDVATKKELEYIGNDTIFHQKIAFKLYECGELDKEEFKNLTREIIKDDLYRFQLHELYISHLMPSLQAINLKYKLLSRRLN